MRGIVQVSLMRSGSNPRCWDCFISYPPDNKTCSKVLHPVLHPQAQPINGDRMSNGISANQKHAGICDIKLAHWSQGCPQLRYL